MGIGGRLEGGEEAAEGEGTGCGGARGARLEAAQGGKFSGSQTWDLLHSMLSLGRVDNPEEDTLGGRVGTLHGNHSWAGVQNARPCIRD